VRVHWEELPDRIRAAIEGRLGDRVVESRTQRGGFSPGLAARLRTSNGRRVFVKAVGEESNPDSPAMHRREAEVVAALPREAPVPRHLWTNDEDGWVVVCFEDVDGRQPAQPWRDEELRLVMAALERLHTVLTPAPIVGATAADALATKIKGWGELLESPDPQLDKWAARNLPRLARLEAEAPAAASGKTLLHFDVRADNLLLAEDKVYFVDWPHARVGAPFVDWVALAPAVSMQGGPQPERLLREVSLGDATTGEVDAVLAAVAGYFVADSRRPPPPGLPTLRSFQAAQGEVAVAWLRERTGWR
jgi:aminoglycoside phosphotransferase (APT) family kinase protein